MSTTAKVTCISKNTHGEGDSRYSAVAFTADYMRDGKKVNQEWAHATPSLSLQLTLKGSAADQFDEGKHYTLTFAESDD